MLTEPDRERYAPQMRIPAFGEDGQARLLAARVLVVGLGGLGSPAAFYLAAAGVGHLDLLDADRVDISNLQRQVLHATPRIGRYKAESAAETLAALNPSIAIEPRVMRLTAENAQAVIAPYDAVLECTDNFPSKYIVNDACVALRKPFATAGVVSLSGQALLVLPGQTPCLRCLVPEPPEGVPAAAQVGILGAAAGILGAVEAYELLQWLSGLWQPIREGHGRLHRLEQRPGRLSTLAWPRRADCVCATRLHED